MTTEYCRDLIPDQQEAEAYLRDVSDANLSYTANKLVDEARHGKYSLDTRTSFLLAVAAVALRRQEEIPGWAQEDAWYLNIAGTAIMDLHAMDLTTACDMEMPYWYEDEWHTGVRQAFDMVQLDPRLECPEFSSAGCTVLLEHLVNGRAHVELPGA